ncbi:MAG: enoyl-CoA hydratase/isomerase family protein [Dehalococcoidia bacterium]
MPDVVIDRQGPVAIVTLNRPQKLNAITPEMNELLTEFFHGLYKDDQTRAVILTGAGRAFCSGGDVSSLPGSSGVTGPGERRSGRGQYPQLYPPAARRRCDRPIIAAIDGYAVGGGLGLALACDLLIASDQAKFGAVQIKRGLNADFGLTYALPRLVGVQKALEMMWTGEIIDAHEAQRLRLVLRVVPRDTLMEEAMAMARKMADAPPLAVAAIKRALYRFEAGDFEDDLLFSAMAQAGLYMTEDAQEGARSFLEKREPRFKGR